MVELNEEAVQAFGRNLSRDGFGINAEARLFHGGLACIGAKDLNWRRKMLPDSFSEGVSFQGTEDSSVVRCRWVVRM